MWFEANVSLFVFIFGFVAVLVSAALNSSAVSSQHHLLLLYAAAAGHGSAGQTTDLNWAD